MGTERDSYPILSLEYGVTLSTFGKSAVQAVVESHAFARTYPDLIVQLQSSDIRTKYNTILPEDVMLDIAERDDCTYDFWADPTGDIIGAWPSSQNPVGTRNSLGWVKLDRREALRQYGGFSLFRAVDNSAGYKREHNYHRDWYREREALHLHLSLMKTSFVTSEPIVAQITLTNTGSVPIRINRSRVLLDPSTPSGAGSDLGFHLIAPSGDQVPLLRKLDSSATIVEEYIELAPNQTITETYNLASSYNIQEPGQYQFWVSNRIASDSNRVVFDVSSR